MTLCCRRKRLKFNLYLPVGTLYRALGAYIWRVQEDCFRTHASSQVPEVSYSSQTRG